MLQRPKKKFSDQENYQLKLRKLEKIAEKKDTILHKTILVFFLIFLFKIINQIQIISYQDCNSFIFF